MEATFSFTTALTQSVGKTFAQYGDQPWIYLGIFAIGMAYWYLLRGLSKEAATLESARAGKIVWFAGIAIYFLIRMNFSSSEILTGAVFVGMLLAGAGLILWERDWRVRRELLTVTR